MGVVYESEDLKLGRRVALKFLSKGAMKDHATLERFWREARTASALNHPSICTVHELNESTDPPFLVMELVKGQRLDKLCPGNPIPSARLIKIAIQIADGLSCAHHQGILHRDIKPSNIVVGDSDSAKLLDFGLAKRMDSGGDLRDAEPNQETLDHQNLITSPGISPGTIAYMSPEQARGEELDCRTDIFSFGIVLYLMATGSHPFQGGTAALVTDRLLHQAPIPPHALNSAVSADLEGVIQKALEKDRDLRYQSTADLLADMKRIQRQSGNISVEPALRATLPEVSRRKLRIRTWIALATLLLCSAAVLTWYVVPRAPVFSSIAINRLTDSGDVEDVALLPDGRMLAEVKSDGPQYALWMRNIPTDTDAEVLSASSLRYHGLTASPDGNRLYFVRQDPNDPEYSNLYSVSVLGGTPSQLLRGIDGPVNFSPDGKKFVYVRLPKPDDGFSSELHVADQEGENDEVLSKNSGYTRNASYSPDGSEVAWVQLEKTGPALILLHLKSKREDRISLPDDVYFIHRLAWLPDGKHLLLNGDLPASNHKMFGQFAVMTVPAGEFRRITSDTASYQGLTLSADARTVATLITGASSRIDYFRTSDGTLLTSSSSSHLLSYLNWIDEAHIALLEMSGDVPGITIIARGSAKFNPIDLGKATTAEPSGLSSCSGNQLIFVGWPLKPTGGAEQQHLLYRIGSDGTGRFPLAGTEGASEPACFLHNQLVHYTIYKQDTASAWAIPIQGGTPHKLLDLPPLASVIYSSSGKIAAYTDQSSGGRIVTVEDLATQKTIRKLELKDYAEDSALHFSRDDKAVIYVQNLGQDLALIYQPINGSPSHIVARLGHERVSDFAWSPSGKELAVLRSISTSDIALISDTTHRFGR